MNKKTLKLNSKRHLTKENKNKNYEWKYIRVRIQENTMDKLGKSLELLNDVYNDEFYYNNDLSNSIHEIKRELIEMIHECHIEENRHKSILDD